MSLVIQSPVTSTRNVDDLGIMLRSINQKIEDVTMRFTLQLPIFARLQEKVQAGLQNTDINVRLTTLIKLRQMIFAEWDRLYKSTPYTSECQAIAWLLAEIERVIDPESTIDQTLQQKNAELQRTKDAMREISINGYGDTSSHNNNIKIRLGKLELYFSYDTIVAFQIGETLIVSENTHGKTTGRHLNIIEPDKTKRLPRAEFEQRLVSELRKFQLFGAN